MFERTFCQQVGFLHQSGDLCFAAALYSTPMIFKNLLCVELYLQELNNGKTRSKVQKLGGRFINLMIDSKSVLLNSRLEIHL